MLKIYIIWSLKRPKLHSQIQTYANEYNDKTYNSNIFAFTFNIFWKGIGEKRKGKIWKYFKMILN